MSKKDILKVVTWFEDFLSRLDEDFDREARNRVEGFIQILLEEAEDAT